jgi:hypothetical protein
MHVYLTFARRYATLHDGNYVRAVVCFFASEITDTMNIVGNARLSRGNYSNIGNG